MKIHRGIELQKNSGVDVRRDLTSIVQKPLHMNDHNFNNNKLRFQLLNIPYRAAVLLLTFNFKLYRLLLNQQTLT